MSKICLNMIVKNEEGTIERCLRSVKPYIDYWIISDTGSADATKSIILQTLQDIPGELIERPWVDFAHNRNEVLKASEGKSDYILFIDADEVLLAKAPFDRSSLTQDSYLIKALGKTSGFSKMFLIKNYGFWEWFGVLHETISSSKPTTTEFLDQLELFYDEESGYRSRNPFKYHEDAKILEEALRRNPDHPRYTFYLAQSYVHARKFDLALRFYEKRIELEADAEEVFWSLYCIGCLKEDLGYPSTEIIQAYSKAYQYKPSQAEPLHRLAMYLQNRPFLNELLIQHAKTIPLPTKAARVQDWIYEKLRDF